MLWDYTPNLDVDITGKNCLVCKGNMCRAGSVLTCFLVLCRPVSLLEKYHSACMTDLWAASSFKGSTSVYTCVPSTQRHVDNHLQWLKVAASVSAGVNLKGIALTGWQR